MAGGPRKPDEGVLPWEFVLVLWAGVTEEEEEKEEEFSKAKGIFLPWKKGRRLRSTGGVSASTSIDPHNEVTIQMYSTKIKNMTIQ